MAEIIGEDMKYDNCVLYCRTGLYVAVVLVCYEQCLAWPIVRSMLSPRKPDILIILANQFAKML